LYEVITIHGCALAIARSNPLRYISLNARASTTLFSEVLSISLLLQEKCFVTAPTPLACNPLTIAAARSPDRMGSSE
jgi:hypothetical protein